MTKLKSVLKQLLAYIPTELPTGMTALNSWIEDVVELTGPIADRDSVVYVAGHETVALSNKVNRISKMRVVKIIRKFAFNQLMSTKLQDINDRHMAAKAAKQAEATATPPGTTPSGQQETTVQ